MDPYCLKRLNEARRARKAAVMLTDLGDGRDRVVFEGEAVSGALGEAIDKAFKSGKSGIHQIDGHEYFLNIHMPATRIVVIGAVHISQALVPMAKIAGFDIQVIDPRTAFASEDRFGDVKLVADWPEKVLHPGDLDTYTALCAVTHDPKVDDYPIAEALKAGCFYVGALGSRKTHGKRLERLRAKDLVDAQLDRIHAPIGLDIGAANPQEIAVAVLAEIISSLRKRDFSKRPSKDAATA
jgi:xanthine dehydrogenase accessory factor